MMEMVGGKGVICHTSPVEDDGDEGGVSHMPHPSSLFHTPQVEDERDGR